MTTAAARPVAAHRRTLLSVGSAVGVLLAAWVVVFVVLDLLPGDAATQRLGAQATPEALAQLRHQWGLDRSTGSRLVDWAGGLLHGDLGTVLSTGAPVRDVLSGALQRSAVLVAVALIGVAILGLGGGVLSGLHADRFTGRGLANLALAVVCTPEFVVATVLVVVFSGVLGWLPAVSLVPAGGTVLDRPEGLVLPALALALVGSATLLRQVRPVVAREAGSAHVEAARLAGLPPARVLSRHLLPGARAPIAQACAGLVPYLVGGAVVIEQVFAFPGVGSVLVSAVSAREPDVVMACVLVLTTVTVAGYTTADLIARRTA